MASASTGEALARVGRRLRARREASGRTLADLADVTGLSVSTLSRLETGQRRPALDLLLPLVTELGIALDDLVRPDRDVDPRTAGPPMKGDGQTAQLLSRGDASRRTYRIAIDRPRHGPDTPLRVHPGSEWLYVVNGRLRLRLGEQDLVLQPGEAAEFDTDTPHLLDAVAEPVEFLVAFGATGERLHVHGVDGA